MFPGRNRGEPLKELRTFWEKVCKAAKITGVRIHDLRHSYASILASSGYSLPMIGALLEHTQAATTARLPTCLMNPCARPRSASEKSLP